MMTGKNIELTETLHKYLLSVSLRESSVLKELRETTATLEMARMQIAPEQGQFMGLLVQLMGAKRAIEVGVFTGYSALCVAQALGKDGRLIACDVNEEWTQMAFSFWQKAGLESRIDLRLAPAVDTLTQLLEQGQDNQFDFAFIDADKTNYQNYYELLLKLVRPGGLIVIDNVLWSGHVLDTNSEDEDTQAIIAFNQFVHQDQRVSHCLLPVADGLSLCIKH